MIRATLYQILESGEDTVARGKAINICLMALVVLNVIAVIVESLPSIPDTYSPVFYGFEIFSVIVFTIEYVTRIWVSVESPLYSGKFFGRLRFSFTPMALVDLLAILPFYLAFFTADLRILRVLRLFRILRILKLGHYSAALRSLGRVAYNKKEELVLTFLFMIMLLIIASSIMYFAERDAQPEIYSSIPAAMWWGIVTLTTVGYGDVYPVTTLGKLFGSVIAILGIGMFALPAGILSSGLLQEIQSGKKNNVICNHCGKEVDA